MTSEEKLAMVKTIMGPDAPDDETISSYLTLAKTEILQWRFRTTRTICPKMYPRL